MKQIIALPRPATSAIAAFLVLSTSSAFAQEAPTITMTPPVAAPTTQTPTPQTPPTVADPIPPAPAASQSAATATPRPVIRVPLNIPEAETPAPQAEAAPTTTRRAETPTQNDRPAAARPAAQRSMAAPVQAAAADPAPAPAPADAAVETAAPITAPLSFPSETAVEPAPLPADTLAQPDNGFPWEIAGGAAALLILGGAGVAFSRRRRSAVPMVEAASVATAQPLAESEQPWITPAYAPPEPAPAARTTPAFAAAPSGSMGRHEAMAMTGPTAENPFATLSKRLKRARFLDRQERFAYDQTLSEQKDMTRKPVSAWDIAQRPIPAASMEQSQEVRRPEAARGRPGTLRPGFTRS